LAVDYDSGMVDQEEDTETYQVPAPWAQRCSIAELGLGTLTDEELHTFCCGEKHEMAAIAGRTPELTEAHGLLDAYFNDWAA